MSGSKWTGSITYSLPDSRSDYEMVNPSASGFQRLSGQNEDAVHAVMASVGGYINTAISYAGRDSADIQVAGFQPGSVIFRSHGYYPGVPVYGGDTWLDTTSYSDFRKGTYAYFLTLHELGHSLGLKHPHDMADHLPRMSALRDSTEFTVMSYNDTSDRPQTFMQYDIAALQAMYGADFSTNSGNNHYTWSNLNVQMSINGQGQGETYRMRIFLTIWDGGGVDTYDMSNFSEGALIDLSPGGFSRFSRSQLADTTNYTKVNGNVYNAFQFKGDGRSLVENAIGGSGSDKMLGSQAANVLEGRDGRDELDGKSGSDTLRGGAGDDTLDGGSGSDVLRGGIGYDFASYTGASSAVVANLSAAWQNTGEAAGDTYESIEALGGSKYGDSLTGNAEGNNLYGHGGNDWLSGQDGRDYLVGGDGDDSLVGGSGGDWLIGGAGYDLAAYSSAVTANLLESWRNTGDAAGDEYESIDALHGSNYADHLTGNHGDNYLYGAGGDDTLFGLSGNDHLLAGDGHDLLVGGAGSDWLTGGTGSDIFRFDNALGAGNVDTVNDFTVGSDKLQLSRSVFTAFANQGSVDSWQFTTGAAASAASHRLIYNNATGAVSYDADGVGGAAQVQFATIGKYLPISASSFALIWV